VFGLVNAQNCLFHWAFVGQLSEGFLYGFRDGPRATYRDTPSRTPIVPRHARELKHGAMQCKAYQRVCPRRQQPIKAPTCHLYA
jgi:hypothetical protein